MVKIVAPIEVERPAQLLLSELANHPDMIRLGFAEMRMVFERQILLSSLHRNAENLNAVATELGMAKNLLRYHVRHTLGRFDLKFEYPKRRKNVVRVGVEDIQQRKLKF